MRKWTIFLLGLVAFGVAAWFIVPQTPIAPYAAGVYERVLKLAGMTEPAKSTSHPLPDALQSKLDEAGLVAGSPTALQILTEDGVAALWLQKDDAYHLLAQFPFCADALINSDPVALQGDYQVTEDDLQFEGNRLSVDLTASDKDTSKHLALHDECDNSDGIALHSNDLRNIMVMMLEAFKAGQKIVPVSIYNTAADTPLPRFNIVPYPESKL